MTDSNTPQPVGEAGAPDAIELLHSVIPKVCQLCQDRITVRQWGQRKNGTLAFTHWSGFNHIPCGASAIREFLTRATQPATAPSEPVELYPGAPERIYLHRDPQGLWRRTAFGDLPDTITYVPARATPTDVAERARRAVGKFDELLNFSSSGYQRLSPDFAKALADIIAAEFGGEGTTEGKTK